MNIFTRTLILLGLAAAASATASAQKLEVRDFQVTQLPTAHLKETEVIDENSGKRAALIKIFTPFRNEELGFDGGLYPILGRKQAGPGEVWLYVPEHIMKIGITHPKYEPVTFFFEGTDAKAGTTYTVNLNVEGRDVALVASAEGSEIFVDGKLEGKSPVNMHMPLGTHHVRTQQGSLLFDDLVTLTRDGETTFNLQMEDENKKFGDVVVNVDNGAELWLLDNREGYGSMRKHLKAGSYVVTAQLPDHEPQTTAFTVEAGKTKTVQAAAPIPHVGLLNIVTEPEHGVVTTQADTVFTLLPSLQLPVAQPYELTFSRRGYYPQTRRYRLRSGEITADTVTLTKIQYVKKTTGYVGVAFKAASQTGVTFMLGGYYENINLEASYTLGLGRSEYVRWWDIDPVLYNSSHNYRLDEWAIKAGYQLRFYERFGLTPQVGFVMQRLSAQDKDYPGNGYTQPNLSIGARLAWHPVQHLGVFVTPEYAIPMGDKGQIKQVMEYGNMTRGGFRANIGVTVSL